MDLKRKGMLVEQQNKGMDIIYLFTYLNMSEEIKGDARAALNGKWNVHSMNPSH